MRPKLRSHYRGQQLALWLDLIPKIHKADSTDPQENLLSNSNNMSTFDEPSRMVNFEDIFPSPPPMPPMKPTIRSYPLTGLSSQNHDVTYDDRGLTTHLYSDDFVTGATDDPVDGVTAGASQDGDMTTSSVPLSITIAVGCSLLFLNLLIFAGVYYQRERIRKLRKRREEDNEDEKLTRKIEKEAVKNNVPEAVGLMTTPSALHPPTKQPKNNSVPTPIPVTAPHPPVQVPHPQAPYSYTAISTSSMSPMHKSANTHLRSTPPRGIGVNSKIDHGHTILKSSHPSSIEHSEPNNAITIV